MSTQGLLRTGYAWVAQIVDPLRMARGLRALSWYLADHVRYRRLPGAEPSRLIDMQPALHERSATHEFDAHYFYVNAWAMRRVARFAPPWHVDVASQVILSALLSASTPVVYVDYRPLHARLTGFRTVGADLCRLPFPDLTVPSLSCLHVAEHVGLGRYGDALDPDGTRKAAQELERVLAPEGNLFFAVPVGRPRLCFNAHRIHAAETIRSYFPALSLIEYSGVHDDGRFVEDVAISEFNHSEYACGMFWFRRAT